MDSIMESEFGNTQNCFSVFCFVYNTLFYSFFCNNNKKNLALFKSFVTLKMYPDNYYHTHLS